jgi:serine/threonine protein kinase
MNRELGCPSEGLLEDFGLGRLEVGSSETIGLHLETCVECRKFVANLSGDDFLGRLRRAQAPAPEAIESLAQSRSETPPGAGSRRAPDSRSVPPELANHPDYELLKELGRGGMGVVYLARNRMMDRLEVLKVVSKKLLDVPGTLERFQQEIRSAAKLNHPNIVGAYRVIRPGDLLVFAMEYVEGHDLAQTVKKRGPLPITNATFYAHQAALGLQHAFEKGMVHRDIKPNNLMLALEGKKHVVKILDFGLAKATSEKRVDGALTKSGQMLGTPDYIAPEQTLDAPGADIRADLYSLGCTLYFLLSGKPPFTGNSLYEILHAHHAVTATPLDQLRPEVPAALAQVVARMMAKQPADRYQTPLDAAKALGPFFKAGAAPPPLPAEQPAVVPQAAPTAMPLMPFAPRLETAPSPFAPAEAAAPAPLLSSATITAAPIYAPPSYAPAPYTPPSYEPPSYAPPTASPVRTKTARKPPRKRGPGLLIAAAAGGCLLCLGIWLVVRDKAGNETARMQVPEGGNVELQQATAAPAPTSVIPAPGPPTTIGVAPPTSAGVATATAEASTATSPNIAATSVPNKVTGTPPSPPKSASPPTAESATSPPRPSPSASAPPPAVAVTSSGSGTSSSTPISNPAADDDEFVSLFNGRDLTGWTSVGGGTWSVQQGDIHGIFHAGSPWLRSDKEYSDFELRLEYNIPARGDSGIFLGRDAVAGSNVRPYLEVQLRDDAQLPAAGPTHSNGCIWNLVDSVKGVLAPAETWNRVAITAHGRELRVTLNGVDVVNTRLPDDRSTSGHIGLQVHPDGDGIRFRNLRLRQFTATGDTLGAAGNRAPSGGAKNNDQAEMARLQTVLLGYRWHFSDSLFPPGDLCTFREDGKFHRWQWNYWVVGPRQMRVHFDQGNQSKDTGTLFTFNDDLTTFNGTFLDAAGREHIVTGGRRARITKSGNSPSVASPLRRDEDLRVASLPKYFGSWPKEFAPFKLQSSNGLVYAGEAFGRVNVLCTHPVSRTVPATIDFQAITKSGSGTLVLYAAPDPNGAPQFGGQVVVYVDGKIVQQADITSARRWITIRIPFNKQPVVVEHHPIGWAFEGMFFDYGFE